MSRHIQRTLLTFLILLTFLSGSVQPALATPGEPGSPEFGVGARLDLDGPAFQSSLTVLKNLHLDWVSIEYSWGKFFPKADSIPDYRDLDQAINTAQSSGAAVVLSLTHTPAWAQTPAGPEPSAVVNLLSGLFTRYPSGFQAVELFPAPNILAGWGAPPDPASYLRLYRVVSTRLAAMASRPLLVAGGMQVLSSPPQKGDLSDVEFISKLFLLAKDAPPAVVGLRYPGVSGSPSSPDDGKYPEVLRHYEEIRRQIRSEGFPRTLLWITYLGLPNLSDRAAQSAWLAEAYPQIRSQLYIGAAFLQVLNPCLTGSACAEVSLLGKDGSLHPFANLLGNLFQDDTTAYEMQPGRGKSSLLLKPK